MNATILEISNLEKHYKNVKALKGISFKVNQGEVFGILGPNGSGKTTTLGILLGVLHADHGDFSWFENGQDDNNRLRIGALLETPNFYPYLSAKDNLKIVARIKEIKTPEIAIDEVLKTVNLYEQRDFKFKTFSLGMRQRLAIASALLNNPEVLVLDEPTNGLDPMGIAEIRSLIRQISKAGKTIIIASHILDEIEKVCTHVAILRKGELLKYGSLEEILSNDPIVAIGAENQEALQQKLNEISGLELLKTRPDGAILVRLSENYSATEINRLFFEKGIVLNYLQPIHQSLEESFIEIVNQ